MQTSSKQASCFKIIDIFYDVAAESYYITIHR